MGIKQAYERNRRAVFTAPGGHEARNEAQQWLTRFDGRGFAVAPDGAAWRWGLELRGYGFARGEHQITGRARVTSKAERVAYRWDEVIEEWFVNEPRGLEHGFTLHARPSQEPLAGAAGAPLELRLAVRGDLRARVQPDGRGVSFVDAAGCAALNYGGLKVWDADGRELPARFAAEADELRLAVDERNARYPLTIDPFAQQAYLKASNTDANDWFGALVAISGDTVVVGAYQEDSNATGINGNAADNSATDAGAAYVFVRSGGVWTQQAYLKASNTNAGDGFGGAVAISGDTMVIGSFLEDSNATGVGGTQTDNSATDSGAAYVFTRTGSVWTQQAYIKAAVVGPGNQFGGAVAIDGNTMVIGAYYEDSDAIGINGNQNNSSAPDAGAAYIFTRTGTVWSQQAYLKASNTGAGDIFGFPVSISGNTVVVGAYSEASNATGVNGNQSDNSAANAGAAYVFVRSGVTWTQQAYLKASNTDPDDYFGSAVAISGDTIVVGANSEDSSAIGVNGNGADNSVERAGAAYVFVRSGSAWTQQAYLKASNTGSPVDYFGVSVAISGDRIVVGANGEDSGIVGNQADNSAGDAGAAYVFRRSGTTWSQEAYLKASSPGQGDNYGEAVAIDGGTNVVGSFLEDSNAVGVNGNQANNSAADAGATYIYEFFTCSGLAIIPTNATLPGGSAGLAYSQSFGATGGSGSTTFAQTAGALPGGLTLTTSGVLSGTPAAARDYTFTITATDTVNACSGARAYTLHINPPCSTITVSPSSLPDASVGTFYSQTITATGGNGPYTFGFSYNSAPAGMTLNPTTGVFSGTPTSSGLANFVIEATDSGGCTGGQVYYLYISGCVPEMMLR